jgi:hypothetical protein
VLFESLFDHLEAGVSFDEFLDNFPNISKDQAVALLGIADKLITSKILNKYMRLLLNENLPIN